MSDGFIYAYNIPKSSAQQAYIEARLAELAKERRERRELRASQDSGKSPSSSILQLERTRSASQVSTCSDSITTSPAAAPLRSRNGSWAQNFFGSSRTSEANDSSAAMDPNLRDNGLLGASTNTTTTGSLTRQSSRPQTAVKRTQEQYEHDLLTNPFELRHGRRFLRDIPYPLPCDLAETQRQNLRTLISTSVFGGPTCSPQWQKKAPKRVLEIGCGSGYWSAMCHDHFAAKGVKDMEFVGLDIAPIAPNLNKGGMKWKFVQHDLRRTPWPFEDGEFDLVMIKDMSLTLTMGPVSEKIMLDSIRLVRPGGTLEVWDSDHVIRSLSTDTPPPPVRNRKEQELAVQTGTFAIPPGHSFIPAQNKFVQKANQWIAESLDRRKLHPTPCVRVAELLLQEPELHEFGQRRVAIPFGELRWERKTSRLQRSYSSGHDSPMSTEAGEKGGHSLTPDQAGLRHTALITFLQMIESMEPMLKEASGKNSEEWSHWWASMMTELLDPVRGGLTGESLEIGAWWATKLAEEE